MTIEFTLEGHQFVALNGGPEFKFNESISLILIARIRKKLTIIGINFLQVEIDARNNADG